MSASSLQDRLSEVQAKVSEAATQAARKITLVAVSKTKPDEDVMAAYDAGQRTLEKIGSKNWREKLNVFPRTSVGT